MINATACFGCGAPMGTRVFEYNGLVLLDAQSASPLARYDYGLCGRCGMVGATARPAGDELDFLYSRFDEFLGRTSASSEGVAGQDDDARRQLASQVEAGWLVSEEAGLSTDAWLPDVFQFRVVEGYHADVIAELVELRGARILELRAFDAHMLHRFRTLHGAAEVVAMPINERHRLVIEQLYGIPTAVIDFDRMTLPPGRFDLVIARHMVTHALDGERFWDALDLAVAPGGALYLYLENDDAAMFAHRKSLFGEMKCFHFQNFDVPTLARVLRFRGYEPEFIRRPRPNKSELVCLARRRETRFEPIGGEGLAARREMYAQWRALSVLSAPAPVRRLFAAELDELTRLVMSGPHVVRGKDGRDAPLRMRLMHDDGYKNLNQ
jgi:hypothetical protein